MAHLFSLLWGSADLLSKQRTIRLKFRSGSCTDVVETF